jgi:uncharacterized protein (TIGR03435 family)
MNMDSGGTAERGTRFMAMRTITDQPSRFVLAAFLFPLFAMFGTALRAQDPRPSFDVASVKANKSGVGGARWGARPGGYRAVNTVLKRLIISAYEIKQQAQLHGGPSWIESSRFDIEARAPGDTANGAFKLDEHLANLMLQSLLEERFKLEVHHESKEIPVYFLVLAKGGHKESKVKGPPSPEVRRFGAGGPVTALADSISSVLGRPVIDKTGLTGSHNFLMEVPIEDYPRSPVADGPALASASAGAVIFAAMEQQLGLKLESGRAPVDVLVIDRVEKPSEN